MPPGEKVIIFLSGSVTGNNFDIAHNCTGYSGAGTCAPTDLQIFGTKASGGQLCLNGNNSAEAFILAPNYTIGVAGGGNSGGFKGAVWTTTWGNGSGCGSQSINTILVQTAEWSSLGLTPKNLPPYIDAPSSWTKQAVQ